MINLKAIHTIARLMLIEAIRNRLFWLSGILVIGFFLLIQFMSDVAVTDQAGIKSAFLASFLRLTTVFILTLFIVSSVSRERHERFLELLLSMPLSRASYFLGKFAGGALVAGVVCLSLTLPLFLYADPFYVMVWVYSLYLESLIVIGVSLLFVITFGQLITALSAVLAFYLLARSMLVIQLITQSSVLEVNTLSHQFMSYAIDIIAFILPALYRFTDTSWLLYGKFDLDSLLLITFQTIVYLLFILAAGLFDLYRKNF